MADTTENTETPGDLRTQISQLQAQAREQTARLLAYEQDEQLRVAGFGHLSKRQRATIIRDLQDEGKDLTPESAKAMAEEHGYPLTAATTTTTTTTTDTNNNGSGQQEQSQEQTVTTDPDVEDSLTAMDLMRRAQQIAQGNLTSSDFETEIRNTKTKGELTDLIRTKGARHNIVHEWDVP